jgi:hypothetical protein
MSAYIKRGREGGREEREKERDRDRETRKVHYKGSMKQRVGT